MSSADLSALVARLETVASRLENISSKQQHSSGGEDSASASMSNTNSHAAVKEYDDLLNHDVKQFVDLSRKIGGDLTEMADLVQQTFAAQRQFIASALTSSKPSNATQMNDLLQPMSSKIEAITKYRESKRSSVFFDHLSTVSESIGALGWVCQEPAPGPFVKEMLAASQFYSNRVLMKYKEKEPVHAEWVKAWTSVLTKLQAYIKDQHTTGITWSALGKSTGGGAAATGGVPPPPPPPPPADVSGGGESGGSDSRANLFAQLNAGSSVTSHLKHVSKEMKQDGKKQPPPTAPKPGVGGGAARGGSATSSTPSKSTTPSAPPKLELQGNKWVVENHRNKSDLVVSDTEPKHTVYIFKCDSCTIQVKGKVNSIVLDSCKKTGLVCDDLISALDVVNCQSVKTQVTGVVPTVNIDKTDGCMVYLSEAGKSADIVTAKSSEMNILVPKGNGDYAEFAVPEQFRTRFDGKSLKTECSEKSA